MPLRLEIKKKLHTRSDRVKSVDFHPTEPWVLSSLYSGKALIYNFDSQSTVKTIEVTKHPVRSAKFVARKQWIVCGCDDNHIRVFNYNTGDKVTEFEAHADFIRHIAVHATLPYLLSASDDMTIRLWNWDRNWDRIHTFEQHAHYVMMCQWNPRDPYIFASASLDRTIKVWGVPPSTSAAHGTVTTPHFQLDGHERGVNCVDYSSNGEKPFLVSGGDDQTVRVWDYQTKHCLAILSGHTKNVVAASFHPQLPLIISGSEDGTIKLWHAATYQLENTLNYMMERVWTVALLKNTRSLAVGYDDGTLVLRLGSENPIASLSGGKLVLAKGSEIQTVNLKSLEDTQFVDGERVTAPLRDLGNCELFPQSMSHHPNGRFIAICGEGEYIIYTSQALRSKAFGKGQDFGWGPDGAYAVREGSMIKVFKNFAETITFRETSAVELFGGYLLALRCGSDALVFHDWNGMLIRRIDVFPRFIFWSDAGDFVCVATPDTFFILQFNQNYEGSEYDDDDGYSNAFDVVHEVNESITSGVWVADCFVYTTSSLRLESFTAGHIDSIAYFDRALFLVGYYPEGNRLYLVDRNMGVASYYLSLPLVQYQSAIYRGELEMAKRAFERIPSKLHDRASKFLEHQGLKEQALEVATELGQKFNLALALGRLQTCAATIEEAIQASKQFAGDSAIARNEVDLNIKRWQQLGDVALDKGDLALAASCFLKAEDATSLFLIASSTCDYDTMRKVADIAKSQRKSNVAVLAYILLNDIDECVRFLIEDGREPEAACLARTFKPSLVEMATTAWNRRLAEAKLTVAVATPETAPASFPDHQGALEIENLLKSLHVSKAPRSSSLRGIRDAFVADCPADLEPNEIERRFVAAMSGAPAGAPRAGRPLPRGVSLLDDNAVEEEETFDSPTLTPREEEEDGTLV